jgi:ABC-type phosphate transport system substrate-binding protein
MISLRKRIAFVGMAVVSSLAVTSVAHAESITAGGATFPDTFIQPAIAEFNKKTGHTLTYAAKGSSDGQTNFKGGLYDMGGTDSAVSSSRTPTFGWNYVPYLAGAIAMTYRLDELKGAQLSLSPGTSEAIFNGTISNWNDPRIANDMRQNPTWANSVKKSSYRGASALWQNSRNAGSASVTVALNPSAFKKAKGKVVRVIDTKTKRVVQSVTVGNKSEIVLNIKTSTTATYEVQVDRKKIASYKRVTTPRLPNKQIIVVYRDGSGTTANFGIYMKSVNSRWGITNDFSANVPGGVTSFGARYQKQDTSANQSNYVANTNGAIGYSETSFAYDSSRQAKGLRVVSLQNNYGEFIQPSAASYNAFLSGATVAANGFVTFNFKTRKRGAYPIGAVTYMLAKTAKSAKSDVVRQFIQFAINDYAPKYGEGLGYVPLSGTIKAKGLEMAKKVSVS